MSTATVSRALRGLPNVSPRTRELVRAAAAELGYVISPAASGLSSGRHRTVAVVVPSLGRWFATEVVEGADRMLRAEGFDIVLIDLDIGPDDRSRLFSHSLLRKRADAVIALGIDFAGGERQALRALALPAVVVGGPVRGVRSVGIDDARAAGLAMEHLLALGHQRIGHLGGENEYGLDRTVAVVRRRVWRTALEGRGLAAPASWSVSGSFLTPQARDAALDLLGGRDRPTALFAASDEMAFGALLAAQQLGLRVPQDLSVVGVDDHAWSASFGLTTVRQDPRSQGARAVRLVLDELAGLPVHGTVHRMPIDLVVRSTTAPPPG